MGERRLQQNIGALDVGSDEFRGAVDRAVDMRFRGEVKDGIGIEFAQNLGYGRPVADVGPAKSVISMAFDRTQRG